MTRTIRIARGGKFLDAQLPKGVEPAVVRRAFAQLAAGAIPFWLTPSERDFVADIIGSFEIAEKEAAEKESAGSGMVSGENPGQGEPPSVVGERPSVMKHREPAESAEKPFARVEERDSGSTGAPELSGVAGGPGEESARERCEPAGATAFDESGSAPPARHVPATEEAPLRAASTAAAGTNIEAKYTVNETVGLVWDYPDTDPHLSGG